MGVFFPLCLISAHFLLNMVLRCTPTEYGHSAILRAVNDAQLDESSSVGNLANNADADRGFFEQNGGASHGTKK